MPVLRHTAAIRLPHSLHFRRTLLYARVKWVRDWCLDDVVQREKNLKPLLRLKNLILSAPNSVLPLSAAIAVKTTFDFPLPAVKFIQNYYTVFQLFRPEPKALPQVRLTRQAVAIDREERAAVHMSPTRRVEAAERLSKLLMLARSGKLPLSVIDRFAFDLGLPDDYVLSFLPDFPEMFEVCSVPDGPNGSEALGLELVYWRKDLAVSEMEKAAMREGSGFNKGSRLPFPMQFPIGFNLTRKVIYWVEEFQNLPYISPYENALHLEPISDQAEKWAVAVLHELLHLLVSKKTEKENVLCLGDFLGSGLRLRFKKALAHHPGIFYVSNKIRTQTVVLREAYRKFMLVEKHPMMAMRYQYIHLMRRQLGRKGKKRPIPLLSKDGGKEIMVHDKSSMPPVKS